MLACLLGGERFGAHCLGWWCRNRFHSPSPLTYYARHALPTPHAPASVLRKASAEYLTALPFDGYAIGGSLGKDRDELKDVLRWTLP